MMEISFDDIAEIQVQYPGREVIMVGFHDPGNEQEYAKKKAAERSKSFNLKIAGSCSNCYGPVYFNTDNNDCICQDCGAEKIQDKNKYGATIPMGPPKKILSERVAA